MDVIADSPWVAVTRAGLAAGDFIAASMGRIRLFAVIAEDQGEQFAVVMAHQGSDPDLTQFPPPAGRSLSVLGSDLLKFTGATIVRAVPEADSSTPQSIPGTPASLSHGDLLVAGEGQVPWMFVEDHLTAIMHEGGEAVVF